MKECIYSIFDYVRFLEWRDYIELTLCVFSAYKIFTWALRSGVKKIMPFLYAYWLLLLGAHIIPLPLIFMILLMALPMLCVVIVIAHQERLVKYLIAPARVVDGGAKSLWVDDFIQVCLIAMNHQKPITAVIEFGSDVNSLIATSVAVNTKINKSLMLMIIESSYYDVGGFLLITNDGTLRYINCHWFQSIGQAKTTDSKQHSWDVACQASARNDCLVLRTIPDSNTFDISVKNNIIQGILSTQARSILSQYILKSHDTPFIQPNKETHNENIHS